jgi:RhtB (resistance to homoserine/threonine) family protein
MLGIQHYWVFLAAGVLLNLTPGQDTLYIVGRSLAHGRRVGIASALGITTGGMIHAAAAALGLSAVLQTSATLFTTVKWIGAAYLIYLGVQMLLNARHAPTVGRPIAEASAGVAYRQGIITNLTNPKVALFFLAFLPQFVDPAVSYKVVPFLLLGMTFNATGAIWCVTLAVAASRFRSLVTPGEKAARVLSRIAGSLFIALGIRVAVGRP